MQEKLSFGFAIAGFGAVGGRGAGAGVAATGADELPAKAASSDGGSTRGGGGLVVFKGGRTV